MPNQIKYYKVGGCVRDDIIGVKAKDIDYAVEAPNFAAMREDILRRGGEIFPVPGAEEKLTIRGRLPVLGVADFVLCRKDGKYSDGRRPDTVEVGSLHDDLARRDFKMNAIAVGEDGVRYDPFNGQQDIAFRLISCVGVAKDRLSEDSLRMLRAIRFSITKGFSIEPAIEACLSDNEMLKLLANVSYERVVDELTECFNHSTVQTMNLLMNVYPGVGYTLFGNKDLSLKPIYRPPQKPKQV